MQRRWQHHGWMLFAALVFGGCAEDTANDDPAGQTEQDAVSGISLALRTVDSQGVSYRLRNATFTVYSDTWYYDGGAAPAGQVLSTETDPDADRLNLRLVPGPYRVELGGDWYLERLGVNGPERVEQVVLLTESVQWTYVYNGWNSDLDYRFGVGGELVDFRHGDLNIDISVELPGEGPTDGGFYPYPPFPPYPYPPYPGDGDGDEEAPTPSVDAGVAR
jgi:hypothetical protein